MDRNRFVITPIILSVAPPASPDTIPITVPRMTVIKEVRRAITRTSREP